VNHIIIPKWELTIFRVELTKVRIGVLLHCSGADKKPSCRRPRDASNQPYTSLRYIAFTNTIFVYFVFCLLFFLYVWPAFCHAIIKRILMMMMSLNIKFSLSLKITQYHSKWYHSKAWVQFLFAFRSKYGFILYHFRDSLERYIGRKSRFFHTPCIRYHL